MTPDKFLKIARKYAPKGIRIRWRRDSKLKPAYANLTKRELLSPKLISVEALAFFIHECAHFKLRHFTKEEAKGDPLLELLYTGRARRTLAHQEYEAEKYTIAALRKEGLVVSHELLGMMRDYVAECIAEGDTLKNKSPEYVRKWIS